MFSTIALFCLIIPLSLMAVDNVDSNEVEPDGIFDYRFTTRSNIEFLVSNYGVNGFNATNMRCSCFWPRGSMNQHIFSQGIWFGAKKSNGDEENKLLVLSFDPNTAEGDFVPGIIDNNPEIEKDDKYLFRTYSSTDFNRQNGTPKDVNNLYNWPVWNLSSEIYRYNRPKPIYIDNPQERIFGSYPAGPQIISEEEFISVFKDTDLNYNRKGFEAASEQGYPIGIQVVQRVYTWSFGRYKNMIIIIFELTNKSDELLKDCWFGGFFDPDIELFKTGGVGAKNDYAELVKMDNDVKMAVSWTDTDKGELGEGFGYVGIELIETPSVDNSGNLRPNQGTHPISEQLGLKSFQSWKFPESSEILEQGYDFLSKEEFDTKNGPGDIRFLMSTGPFNMKPGESAQVGFAINIVAPSSGVEANGTLNDMKNLLSNRELYYTGHPLAVEEINKFENETAAWPNPSNGKFYFSVQNPKAGHGKFRLIDIMGNEITNFETAEFLPGKYNLDLNMAGKNLPGGMYLLNAEIGGEIYSRKVIISN
jgi:hypothetical protein